MDMLALLAAVTVMAAIICGMMAVYSASAQPRTNLQRRLGSLLGDQASFEMAAMASQALRAPKTGHMPIVSSLLKGKNWTADMSERLERADIKLTVSEFVGVRLFLGFLIAFLPILMVGGFTGFVLAFIAGLFGFWLPGFYLGFATNKRVKKLEKQLIDTLILVSNSLKAGFGLMQALDLAARELPHPISTELRHMLHDVNVGSTSEEALAAMAKRCGSKDIDIVITAMLIQQATGGNLSEILDNVATTMRERIRIRGEITTLTTQQMMTGFIIGGLPFVMAGAFQVMSPEYMKPLYTQAVGIVMLCGAGILELFGVLIIKKILTIEV